MNIASQLKFISNIENNTGNQFTDKTYILSNINFYTYMSILNNITFLISIRFHPNDIEDFL